MRLGAKATYCRNKVKINGDLEFRVNEEKVTNEPDKTKPPIQLKDDKGQSFVTCLYTPSLSGSLTGKYDFQTILMGLRIGYVWSSTNDTGHSKQIIADAPYGEGDMRTGFAPTSCPAFNFDYNPEDHTAGGNIVMSKLSLNTAYDDLGGTSCDMIGSVEVYDSRFSSLDPTQNWSLGVIFKGIQNLTVGIVGNSRSEVGVGIGIRLPFATMGVGICNRVKHWSADPSNIFGGNQFRYSLGLEFPPLPEPSHIRPPKSSKNKTDNESSEDQQ